jgi:hypothetical protein
MYIYELVVPGTRLDYEDRDWSWSVEGLLRNLQSQFFEANLALNLFSSSQQGRLFPTMNREKWERDTQRRSEIQRVVEMEKGGMNSHENWEEVRFETDVRFKREQWAGGAIPREFEHNTSFLYARAFLYALDGFDKFLGVLSKTENAPEAIAEIHGKMAKAFPALREVRNSAHHIEDRTRFLGKYGKPLDLKPVDNEAIKASGGALVLNNLNGSKYGSTMADGHFGEVDVSPESMTALQGLLSEVLSAYKWKGPKQHLPSA